MRRGMRRRDEKETNSKRTGSFFGILYAAPGGKYQGHGRLTYRRGLLTRWRLTNLMASIGFCFPSVYMHNRPAICTSGFSYFSWDVRERTTTSPGSPGGKGVRQASRAASRGFARRHGPGGEFRFRYKPSFLPLTANPQPSSPTCTSSPSRPLSRRLTQWLTWPLLKNGMRG